MMKHSQWLRLKTEGEKVCSALRRGGYQCIKQSRRLSWKISKNSTSYLLTWLPSPVAEWSLIPNDGKPEHDQLNKLIASAIAYRGSGS